jgi:hypothetical protein
MLIEIDDTIFNTAAIKTIKKGDAGANRPAVITMLDGEKRAVSPHEDLSNVIGSIIPATRDFGW